MFDSLIIRRQPQKMTIFKRGVVGILFVRSFMPLLFFPGNGSEFDQWWPFHAIWRKRKRKKKLLRKIVRRKDT